MINFYITIFQILSIYFYGILYQVSIQIRNQKHPVEVVLKKIKRNKRLVLCSCIFLAILFLIILVGNIFSYPEQLEQLTFSYKLSNTLISVVYILLLPKIIQVGYKIVKISIQFIRILNFGYKINLKLIYTILFVVYGPLFFCALQILVAQFLWIYHIWTETNCSTGYQMLQVCYFYLATLGTQSLSFIVLFIIWYFACQQLK